MCLIHQPRRPRASRPAPTQPRLLPLFPLLLLLHYPSPFFFFPSSLLHFSCFFFFYPGGRPSVGQSVTLGSRRLLPDPRRTELTFAPATSIDPFTHSRTTIHSHPCSPATSFSACFRRPFNSDIKRRCYFPVFGLDPLGRHWPHRDRQPGV